MRSALLLVTAAVAAAMLLSEAAMRPEPADRLLLLALFVSMAAVTVVAAWWLPGWAGRRASLRTSLLIVPLSAVGLAGLVVATSAITMFLSGHDLRLVLVALVLALGLGGALAVAIAGPLASDMADLAAVARRIGSGAPAARHDVDRRDEVGALARAMDEMSGALADARAERERGEAARREFLAAVSHDLRTPLTAIQAAVEAMLDGVAADPQRYLESIAQELALLRRLVDDLFLLARIEAGDVPLERIPLDLGELADEAVDALAPVARGKGITLETARVDAALQGDPHALGRILRNVLDNAIRHAPAGSTVRIATHVENGHVLITVRDDGPGFPPAFIDRAVESFTKADPARTDGGAGLGLAIAQGLVDVHGGRLRIDPGPGGVVTVALPLADEGRPTGW